MDMINFKGEECDGNLVLTGFCARCGHQVARLVETSQVDSSGN
jgi:rRNA maturation endonuclease Nob1